MLPSKGLRWSRQTIAISRRHLDPFSARHCSSVVQNETVRASVPLSRTGALSPRIYKISPFSRPTPLIRHGAGIRLASTAPAVAATSNPSPVETPPGEVLPSSLDGLTDFTSGSLYDIPEHIGYLKSFGLEYGWGPTSSMQWILEHIHVYAGTPWWVSISLTAIVVRIAMFKIFVNASDNGARMQVVKPITDPLNKEILATRIRGDEPRVLQLRAEVNAINKRAGIKALRGLGPALQILPGCGTFILLRAMVKVPVPGLETGGALWFHNLTIADPYYIIPVTTALALHWVLRKGGETSTSTMSPQATKIMVVAFPALTLLITAFMPAALQVSFFVAGMISLIQSTLFRMPGFRSYFNMYPLPPPTPATPTPYKGTMNVRAPLSQEELSRTYQASRPTTAGASELKAGQQALHDVNPSQGALRKFVSGTVGGAVKDIKTTVQGATSSARDLVGRGQKGLAEKQAKSERATAQAYEERRQREIAREQYERREERKAQRVAKMSTRSR